MIQLLKTKLLTSIRSYIDNPTKQIGEFSIRIINRHRAFWKAADAEYIRNLPMNASMPIEQWKAEKHWQRKLSNKYNSREFAKLYGCRVPELYWKGRDLSQLNFTGLPEQYVIRPTIGYSCKLVFIMNKGLNIMDNRSYSEEQLKEAMTEALRQNPNLEFLIEEFVRSEEGQYKIPNDYKMYLFNGELAVIQVINRLGPKIGFSSCYDENWNMIENVTQNYQQALYQEKPACLDEMVTQARRLSKAYEIFVRVDFYATDKGAVFGEFTPTPAVGKGFTPNANKMLISYWDRSCNGMI